MLALGAWTIHSASDPRWRANGEAQVGMFMSLNDCPAAKAEYERMKDKYGDPPEDCTFSYCKY